MEARELIDMMDARAADLVKYTALSLLQEQIREALVIAYLEGQQAAMKDATAAVDRAFDKAAK